MSPNLKCVMFLGIGKPPKKQDRFVNHSKNNFVRQQVLGHTLWHVCVFCIMTKRKRCTYNVLLFYQHTQAFQISSKSQEQRITVANFHVFILKKLRKNAKKISLDHLLNLRTICEQSLPNKSSNYIYVATWSI